MGTLLGLWAVFVSFRSCQRNSQIDQPYLYVAYVIAVPVRICRYLLALHLSFSGFLDLSNVLDTDQSGF